MKVCEVDNRLAQRKLSQSESFHVQQNYIEKFDSSYGTIFEPKGSDFKEYFRDYIYFSKLRKKRRGKDDV